MKDPIDRTIQVSVRGKNISIRSNTFHGSTHFRFGIVDMATDRELFWMNEGEMALFLQKLDVLRSAIAKDLADASQDE